jgi:small subunit ribosomal protein S6
MRDYEFTVILPPEQKKEERKDLIEKIEGWVKKKGGGKVVEQEEWGKKSLAYPIKGEENGFYIRFDLELDEDKVEAFNNRVQLENKILRYLIVKK